MYQTSSFHEVVGDFSLLCWLPEASRMEGEKILQKLSEGNILFKLFL